MKNEATHKAGMCAQEMRVPLDQRGKIRNQRQVKERDWRIKTPAATTGTTGEARSFTNVVSVG